MDGRTDGSGYNGASSRWMDGLWQLALSPNAQGRYHEPIVRLTITTIGCLVSTETEEEIP